MDRVLGREKLTNLFGNNLEVRGAKEERMSWTDVLGANPESPCPL